MSSTGIKVPTVLKVSMAKATDLARISLLTLLIVTSQQGHHHHHHYNCKLHPSEPGLKMTFLLWELLKNLEILQLGWRIHESRHTLTFLELTGYFRV